MPIAFVQSKTGSGSSLVFNSNCTSGNWVCVQIGCSTTTIPTVSGNGNTYNQVLRNNTDATYYWYMYYAENINGGATTISIGGGASVVLLNIYEFSGIKKFGSLDQSGSQGSHITPTANGELIFDMVDWTNTGDSSSFSVSASGPWTLGPGQFFSTFIDGPFTWADVMASEWQIQTTAASIIGSYSTSGGDGGAVLSIDDEYLFSFFADDEGSLVDPAGMSGLIF